MKLGPKNLSLKHIDGSFVTEPYILAISLPDNCMISVSHLILEQSNWARLQTRRHKSGHEVKTLLMAKNISHDASYEVYFNCMIIFGSNFHIITNLLNKLGSAYV